MNNIIKILLSIVILINLQSCYNNEDLISKIKKRGFLKVGVTDNYPPYSYLDKFGNYKGSDIDKAYDLAKTLNVSVKLIPTSYLKLVQDLKRKKFDIAMCGLDATDFRKKYGYFSIPYESSKGKVFLTKCSNIDSVGSEISEFDNIKTNIIVAENTSAHETINKLIKKARIVPIKEFNRYRNPPYVNATENDYLYVDYYFSLFIIDKYKEYCICSKIDPQLPGFSYYMIKDK